MIDGSDVRSEVQQGLEEEREQWQRSAREQIAITRQTAIERDHYKAEVERLRKDAKLAAAIVRINPEVAGRAELEAEVKRLREEVRHPSGLRTWKQHAEGLEVTVERLRGLIREWAYSPPGDKRDARLYSATLDITALPAEGEQ